jgi:hypothetical protein
MSCCMIFKTNYDANFHAAIAGTYWKFNVVNTYIGVLLEAKLNFRGQVAHIVKGLRRGSGAMVK